MSGELTLIQKLEAAPEGSRELDGDIWWFTDPAHASRVYYNATSGPPRPLGPVMPHGLGRLAVEQHAPHYTTSIDAAIKLVPAGHGWACDQCSLDAHAFVFLDDRINTAEFEAWAETIPLAICKAALKANLAAESGALNSLPPVSAEA